MKNQKIRHRLLLSSLLFPLLMLAPNAGWAKSFRLFLEPDAKEVYKEIEGKSLDLHIFYPDDAVPAEPAPAIVFFHGGGFSKGQPKSFYFACDYFASRGMVAMSGRYRLAKGKEKIKCLKDAKSAMRYIKKNAAKFGIDPDRIVSAGGSAGGSLAGAMATSRIINEDTDDLSITIDPVALVLFNPIGVGTEEPSGFMLWSPEVTADFTPGTSLHSEMPPVLCLWGENDKFVGPQGMKRFQEAVQALGVRCEIESYPGQAHSFFDNTREWVITTLSRADVFLASVGVLEGEPKVEEWLSQIGK